MRGTLVAALLGVWITSLAHPSQAQTWSGDSIVNPLTSSPGDAAKGRVIVVSRQREVIAVAEPFVRALHTINTEELQNSIRDSSELVDMLVDYIICYA